MGWESTLTRDSVAGIYDCWDSAAGCGDSHGTGFKDITQGWAGRDSLALKKDQAVS